MRYQGRITTWKDAQGFGFITPNGGGEPVFLHISAFSHRKRRPEGDELVTYELKRDAKGRLQALKVAFVGDSPRPAATSYQRSPVLPMFAFIFLCGVAGAVWAGQLPAAVLGLYLAASVVTFGAYAIDKSAARHHRQRTAENTLHLLALLGGWPGALAGQRLFRHKTAKRSFMIIFWVTVLINNGVLLWALSPAGASVLKPIGPSH
ncbi:DUF1294 domain-containing protein [Methylovorus mays]|uniref:DUF1294 domain-containing protein n=1 Tax=Methylovorus mays TaxID=184077 RepID=UPI001E54BD8C|nr:cold shock and DUF1294 domain-containing protein [Methylovorus mays]MCB5208146.1 cold shock and DUF1294 domain-containing protein [Methylovorus mays]